jgi:hypothetical protein
MNTMQKHYSTWKFLEGASKHNRKNGKPEIILSEDDNGYPLWYQDGELNVCYLPLTTHTRWLWRSSGVYLWFTSNPNHENAQKRTNV